jgi:hypothetical protein
MSPRCSPTAISLLVLQMGRSSLRRCSMGVPDSTPRTTYQMNCFSSATSAAPQTVCQKTRSPCHCELFLLRPFVIGVPPAVQLRRSCRPPDRFQIYGASVVLFCFPCIEFYLLGSISFYIPSMIVFCLFHGLVSSAEYVFYFLFSSVFLSCPSLGREL